MEVSGGTGWAEKKRAFEALFEAQGKQGKQAAL